MENSRLDLTRTLLTLSKFSANHFFVHLLLYPVPGQKMLTKGVLPWYADLGVWGSGSGALEHKNSNSVLDVLLYWYVLGIIIGHSAPLADRPYLRF